MYLDAGERIQMARIAIEAVMRFSMPGLGVLTGVPTAHEDANVSNAKERKSNNYQEKEESHQKRYWHLKERRV